MQFLGRNISLSILIAKINKLEVVQKWSFRKIALGCNFLISMTFIET